MENNTNLTPNDNIETLDTTPEVLNGQEVKQDHDVLNEERVETMSVEEGNQASEQAVTAPAEPAEPVAPAEPAEPIVETPKEDDYLIKAPEIAPSDESIFEEGEFKKKRSIFSTIILAVVLLIVLCGLGFYFIVYEKSNLMQKAFNKSMSDLRKDIDDVIDDIPNFSYKKGYSTLELKAGEESVKYDFALNLDKAEVYLMAKNKTGIYAKNDMLYMLNKDKVFSQKLEKDLKEYYKEQLENQKGNKDDLKISTRLLKYAQEAVNNKFDKSKVTEKKVKYEFGRACKGLDNCKSKTKTLRKLTYELNPDNLYQMKEEFVRLVEKDKKLVKMLGEDEFKKFKEEVKDSKIDIDRESTKFISIYMDFLDAKVIEIKEEDQKARIEKHNDVVSIYTVEVEDKKEVLGDQSISFDKNETGKFIYKNENKDVAKGTYKFKNNTYNIDLDIMDNKIKINGKATKDMFDTKVEFEILGKKANINFTYDFTKDVPKVNVANAKNAEDMTEAEAKDLEASVKEALGILYNLLPKDVQSLIEMD